ncbi:hypothetical protein SAMN04515667_2405 [Formosa sp. Hel1_31_208]|uniref:DUF6913 domain-containing protein n=1 Tax=Formosa sp. Hel1_31_208 TaxID=1798225 RepID=UPI00087C499C|nr:hypothetical protein [Formosa sp. Hel1_31_208]SDS54057.1 hypothetical protein SAMN04515667_2405 [Formosa sp. Hel1_31_208]
MILKAFKKKSNQKYINKLLNARRVAVSNTKMKTIGVILNVNEFADFDAFRSFFKSLNIQEAKTKIVAFVDDPKGTNNLWDTYFNPKDFGWKGKINSIDLQTFIDTQFDVLICFYKEHHIELDIIAALSKSNFKVGIMNEDQRLYDLIIDVKPQEFSLFKEELKKYLTVLNKL